MDYSLEFLEIKFKQHSRKFIKERESIKKNRKDSGCEDDTYPDEDFNLPLAFVKIIQEIRALKGD